jgi:hypothetical protein
MPATDPGLKGTAAAIAGLAVSSVEGAALQAAMPWTLAPPGEAAIRDIRAGLGFAAPIGGGSAVRWLPTVGEDILGVTRTCRAGRVPGTPATGSACDRWSYSGPVNVVIVSRSRADPLDLVAPGQGWGRAAGNWLVAGGAVRSTETGCAPGWHDSARQVELHMKPQWRRHFKAIHVGCKTSAGGVEVTFGDAHTDFYDQQQACHGDRAADWDEARDQLVQSLLAASPGSRVTYVQAFPTTVTFPGGCGHRIPSDGRVAYLTLAGVTAPDGEHPTPSRLS